jgi:FG-GAP-like repeat/IPT/TIG domain
VAGDFNHDGNLDFAVTWQNVSNGYVQVFLGNGAGSFTAGVTYTLAIPNVYTIANGLATADLRGNGKLDLIAVDGHNNGGSVEVLLGNGDGSFHAPVAVATSISSPLGVAIADVNHDGKMDMVVASNDSGDGIYVVLGNGNGTFQTPVFYSEGDNSGATGIAIGSLTTKKNEDVVISTGNGAYVYLNDGTGAFAKPVQYGSSANASSVVIADVNGDKKNDLVLGSTSSGATWVLLGKGNGTFSAGTAYNNGGVTSDVVVADFNGDKKLDFAAASNAEYVDVALGNGDGTFRSSSQFGNTGATIQGIAAADLNGDGYPDVVEAGGGTGVGITVLLGSSHGVLGTSISTAVGTCGEANRNPVSGVALGDVNGDGKVDVVATSTNTGFNFCVNNEIAVLDGLGTGKFKAPVFYSTGTTQQSYNPSLGDFNGDGKLDIVVSNADGSISVLLNNGKGVYEAAKVIPGASGTEGAAITLGDFNKDGKLDIALTDYSGTAVNILLGKGDGTFKAPISTPVPYNPSAIAAGDFNGDGKLDLAITSWNNAGELTIFTGNGDGTFAVGGSYAIPLVSCQFGGSNPYWISTGDLNGDGKLDLAVALNVNYCETQYNGNEFFGDAMVFIGKGDGTFNLDEGWMGGGNGTNGLALADFNDDGMTDIAVAGYGNSTEQWVSVLQNSTQPISVSPLQITYAAKDLGVKSPPSTVVITNDASASLKIDNVSLGGADPGDFSLKSACGTSLSGGANCTLTIVFTPTTTGKRTATLSIVDGDGTQTVSLTGDGEQTITSFTPTSGPVGTSVTITGTSLTGTTKVTFDGVAATTFKVVSETEITATVPTGAKTGKIGVTTNGVTVDSKTSFTVN